MIFPFGASPKCVSSDGYIENGEVRHQHLGVDDSGKIVFMVTTMRPDETVRLISFRRASPNERRLFGSMTAYQEPESKLGSD